MTAGRAGDARIRTVFVGSGGFGRTSLRRLAGRHDVDLVGIVTAPPRPAGRGRHEASPPIHDLARDLALGPVLVPERLRAPAAVAAVLELAADLLVLADYGQIVPAALLQARFGALNLHPSLLPRHRGATPIPAAILAGDEETGVTLMRMDDGLDTGPIVAQVRVALDGTETTPRLEAALEIVAADLLDRDLGPWIQGAIETRPQPETGATLTRPHGRSDGRLDPALPAIVLERQVRAFQPWPGSFAETVVGRLAVWAADVAASSGWAPGIFGERGLSTADGELVLREVQPAGGRRMDWEAFVRGRPGIVGSAALASER